MQYTHPEFLTDAATLNDRLHEPQLRIFDTAVYLQPTAQGNYQVSSGLEKYTAEHIPGAGFIDLVNDWSDSSSELNFTLPQPAALADAISQAGISMDSEVVLYSSGHLMWATRAWWLLHYAGHRKVSILNGNINAWREADLPLEQGVKQYQPTRFDAAADARLIASTNDVVAGMDGKVCTVNTLSQSLYEGTGDFYYTRRGHIPGSQLLYYDAVLDNEFFLPAAQLAETLEKVGMLSADRVITYCGGGIAATLDAFACALLGQMNVAVYDGSMSEWVQDEGRPLTTGPAP